MEQYEEQGSGAQPGETAEVVSEARAPWWSILRRPVVWGPTAGVAAMLTGVLVAVATTGPGASVAADATASSEPSIVTVTASASPTAVPSAAPSQEPSATVSPAAVPEPHGQAAEPQPTVEATEPAPSHTLDAVPAEDLYGGVALGDGGSCAYPGSMNLSYADVALEIPSDRGPSTPGAGSAEWTYVSQLGRISRTAFDAFEWAPDGTHAVVVTDRPARLRVVDESGAVRDIGTGYDVEILSAVRWSHEGDQLAFVSLNGAGGHDLVVYDLASRSSRVVASANRINGYDFVPGGDAIAYGHTTTTSRYRMAWGSTNVNVVDLGTGAASTVVAGAGFPSYSPDGARLVVFGDADADGRLGATLVTLADGAQTPLGDDTAYSGMLPGYWDRHTASWSPDGRNVAVVTGGTAHRNVTMVVVARASGEVVATAAPEALDRPVWTRDSKHVAYAHFSLVAVDAASGQVEEMDFPVLPRSLVVAGNRFVVRAPACGTTDIQSLLVSPTLDSLAPLGAPDGWIDVGVPHSSVDGKVLRLLVAPGSSGIGLYLG